ncbi:MAG: hypothetical protein WEB52_10440 [Dehalococcoidia bacterium]
MDTDFALRAITASREAEAKRLLRARAAREDAAVLGPPRGRFPSVLRTVLGSPKQKAVDGIQGKHANPTV